jgi:hypothetical protein
MLMEINPRVSGRATCSYTTVADRTCKTIATALCSSCERFACTNHVLTRNDKPVCAACDFNFRKLTEQFDASPTIGGIPVTV